MTENGIEDTKDRGDGVIFRVDVNGRSRYQQFIPADRRWHPVGVDLTGEAGTEVRLLLMTNPRRELRRRLGCLGRSPFAAHSHRCSEEESPPK